MSYGVVLHLRTWRAPVELFHLMRATARTRDGTRNNFVLVLFPERSK
jgi:hypothetical protein